MILLGHILCYKFSTRGHGEKGLGRGEGKGEDTEEF